MLSLKSQSPHHNQKVYVVTKSSVLPTMHDDASLDNRNRPDTFNSDGQQSENESIAEETFGTIGEAKNKDLGNETWDEMFCRLLQYRAKFGHCRVPNRYKEDSKLGTWVSVQRWHYRVMAKGRRKKTPLTPERVIRLEKIGFQWSCQIQWKTHFMQLLEFVALNGHAQVPMKWEKNVKFAAWVSSQRRKYAKKKNGLHASITEDQVKLLDSIGFVWKAERGGKKRIQQGSLVPAFDKALATVSSPVYQQNAIQLLKTMGQDAPSLATATPRPTHGNNTSTKVDTLYGVNASVELLKHTSTATSAQIESHHNSLNPSRDSLINLFTSLSMKPNLQTSFAPINEVLFSQLALPVRTGVLQQTGLQVANNTGFLPSNQTLGIPLPVALDQYLSSVGKVTPVTSVAPPLNASTNQQNLDGGVLAHLALSRNLVSAENLNPFLSQYMPTAERNIIRDATPQYGPNPNILFNPFRNIVSKI